MFVWPPQKRKGYLEGYYLILIKDKTCLRARVIKTRMKLTPEGLVGTFVADYTKYSLKGLFGNNGPMIARPETALRGMPLPAVLETMLNQGMLGLYHGDWRAELAQYGRNLYLEQQKGFLFDYCFRCGKASEKGEPCQECADAFRANFHKPGMTPPDISIGVPGIPSEETVGHKE